MSFLCFPSSLLAKWGALSHSIWVFIHWHCTILPSLSVGVSIPKGVQIVSLERDITGIIIVRDLRKISPYITRYLNSCGVWKLHTQTLQVWLAKALCGLVRWLSSQNCFSSTHDNGFWFSDPRRKGRASYCKLSSDLHTQIVNGCQCSHKHTSYIHVYTKHKKENEKCFKDKAILWRFLWSDVW